ncbi:hypothetical protein [Paraglaciecola marina]|uniref:hypothetical protein n=1 Tax=Paraglaciecola marina TaxID=2500157 RepID=UPI001060B332|nr:hypothetical protein [Paraglaciecola marina]
MKELIIISNRHYCKLLLVLIYFLVQPLLAAQELNERVNISGFARVVGGYLDESNASYGNYSNEVSFSEQSLLAIQADLLITDTISASGQLLAHSSDERDSGIEWLYLTYEPNNSWLFKFGKLRTPFFRYTDVIDVGFSYPWISPPQQVYSGFLFSNYEGASGTYKFNFNDLNFDIEAYYGTYSGEFSRAGENIDIEVDEIKGIIFTLNRGNFSARASITQSSDFFADFPGFNEFSDILEYAGYPENAESLRFNGAATGYQASVNYDTLDYFVAAEWVKIDSELLVVPQLDSYYLTLGYNFDAFQVHITYANSDSSYNIPENLIPKYVTEELTELSFIYDGITQNLPLYTLESLTIGLRWDLKYNISAKAEVTYLSGEQDENSFFEDITNPDFDRKATLYQIGLEWVF